MKISGCVVLNCCVRCSFALFCSKRNQLKTIRSRTDRVRDISTLYHKQYGTSTTKIGLARTTMDARAGE